jgi:hypothetical protein
LGAVFAAAVFFRFRRRTPRFLFSARHRDDQRDVLAYILGAHGFYEEADWARGSERRLSYWSGADRLTEGVLRSPEKDKLQRAIKCLEALLDYAGIEDTRACHQLAGFGRWAPPTHGIGSVSPDCHTQPSIGAGRCVTNSGAVVSSIHRRSACGRLTDASVWTA